jgi:hypothetical protein
MLDHGGNDDTATIRAHGRLDHDTGNAAIITALKRANAKMGLDFAKVGPAGFIAPCIAGENLGGGANLRGNGDEHVGRRALPALREHGRRTSDRRDERQTQTVRIAPRASAAKGFRAFSSRGLSLHKRPFAQQTAPEHVYEFDR